MKKIIASVLAAASIASISTMSCFAEQTPSVYLDGTKLEFQTEPFIENDRTLIPMRAVFEAVGAEVAWDQTYKTVAAIKDKTAITLQIDNKTAYVNSDAVSLDVPAKVINDTTFVPLRFVIESLGEKVEWDGENFAINITTQ